MRMPRLIDANEILKSEHQHYDYRSDEYYVHVRDIENAPTVDAEPVVRCKNCKYCSVDRHADGNVPDYVCIEMDCGVEPNGFCSWGEKREDDDNLISNRKCSECLRVQNITGLRKYCHDCEANGWRK